MALIYSTILKNYIRKDGLTPIRIAIQHKGSISYIKTNYLIAPYQWKGKVIGHPESNYINHKLSELVTRYIKRLDLIEFQDSYSSKQLSQLLVRSPNPDWTFGSYSAEVCKTLKEEGRSGTYDIYSRHSKIFLEYLKCDLPLEGITPDLIDDFGHWVKRKRKLKSAYTNSIMRSIKAIVNRAIREQRVKYSENPFCRIKIPASPMRDSAISVETMVQIKNAQIQSKAQALARDLFMLSFYCGGMNFVDMLAADWGNDTIEYSRQKVSRMTSSNSVVKFTLPPQAKEIVGRLADKNGKLKLGKYKYSDVEDFRRYVTLKLKLLQKDLNLKEHIMLYSARKSFAQYAADLGFQDAVIDYCLGHSSRSRGIISYYTQVRPQQASIVLSRVADYVEHPDKYKDLIEMRYVGGLRLPDLG